MKVVQIVRYRTGGATIHLKTQKLGTDICLVNRRCGRLVIVDSKNLEDGGWCDSPILQLGGGEHECILEEM